MTQEVKESVNKFIQEIPRIKNILGDILIDDIVSIEFVVETKYSKFFHKGIYKLHLDVLDGLYFYNIGLINETDETYGVSQFIYSSSLMVKDFDYDGNSLSMIYKDFDYHKRVGVKIKKKKKEQIFENTELSWSFIVNSLDKIKKEGIEVPKILYPFDHNCDYDSQKTHEFLKQNLNNL